VDTPIVSAPQGIKDANQRLMDAFRQGDAATIAALYTDDGQVLAPNNQIVAGRPAIQAFYQAMMGLEIRAIRLDEVEVEVYGETANEVATYQLLGEDKQVLEHGKCLVVWKATQRGWKMHRDCFNTSLPSLV